MNMKTEFRVVGLAIVLFQAAGGLAFGIELVSPGVQTTPAMVCMPAVELPMGHDNLVDINSAPKDWLVWAGIDESLAGKIISSRPFLSRTDLLSRRILSREAYEKIKNRIIARQV
jgi:hypothetical protein